MMHAGDITVGNLTSFLIYTAYVGMSIVGISTAYSDIMKGVGASERLFQLLERSPAMPLRGGDTISEVSGGCCALRQRSWEG
jgi:ABC-type multidrug transport system fused ATPase/permease subunit